DNGCWVCWGMMVEGHESRGDKDCWFLLGMMVKGSGGSWVVVGRQEKWGRRSGKVGGKS
nr:hypothetical protein [Tanacetum cinerariifolium]